MVDMGRSITDTVKVFPEKALAAIHPLAGTPSLNKSNH